MAFNFHSRCRRSTVRFIASSLFVFGLPAILPSANAQVSCEGLFKEGSFKTESVVAAKLVGAASLSPEAKELIASKWQGISDRGFVSSKIAASAVLSAEVAKEGLIWWYLRVFVVDSVDAARAHSALEKDPLMQGVYLINKDQATAQTADLIHQPAPEVFRRMLKNDGMYFFKILEGNTVEMVPSALIEKVIAVDELKWDLDDPEHGPYISSPGWAFPRYRGVIKYASGLDSTTYQRTRRLARQLIGQGFRVSFNHDFVRSLNMVRDQKRKIDGQWVENSLYAGENNANYLMTLESYKAGRAYSVEVWNEKNELVGGIIGFRDGSMYSPESTFYNEVGYPKVSIGFAKVAVVALMDRLHAAGIDWADAGMVTPFTASMKGELVLSTEFLELASKLPPGAVMNMESNWTP